MELYGRPVKPGQYIQWTERDGDYLVDRYGIIAQIVHEGDNFEALELHSGMPADPGPEWERLSSDDTLCKTANGVTVPLDPPTWSWMADYPAEFTSRARTSLGPKVGQAVMLAAYQEIGIITEDNGGNRCFVNLETGRGKLLEWHEAVIVLTSLVWGEV